MRVAEKVTRNIGILRRELTGRGIIKRPEIVARYPLKMTIEVRPTDHVVEMVIMEYIGRLGWLMKRKTFSLGNTIMEFEKPAPT